ncbi:hypothetical protein L6V77_31430 [Myxococcota bacterium]|nr:hypothetical protein [Myxococcota bacterium]
MTKGRGVRLGAMLAVAMGIFGFGPASAWAWEPVPADPGLRSTVTRVVDVGRSWNHPARVALAEAPAAACAAIAADQRGGGLYGEAWVSVYSDGGTNAASETLAVALAARAQNLPVRVTIMNWNGLCMIQDLRTCVDAAVCALPPAP